MSTKEEESSNELLVSARTSLAALDVQRKALESEAEAITTELTSPTGDNHDGPPIGIDTPLVDAEGYPRNDIDVYRARHLRHRLAEIRTDHTKLMTSIQQGLHQMAMLQNTNKSNKEEQQARQQPKPKPKMDPVTGKWVVRNWDGSVAGIPNGHQRSFEHLHTPEEATTAVTNLLTTTTISSSSSSSSSPKTDIDNKDDSHVPFAKVDAVAMASPAFQAGLREGDFIVSFGSVNHTNNRELKALLDLVPMAASTNHGIPVVVSRYPTTTEEEERGGTSFSSFSNDTTTTRSMDNHRVQRTFMLHPKPWAGRGLLGCHIVKYPVT